MSKIRQRIKIIGIFAIILFLAGCTQTSQFSDLMNENELSGRTENSGWQKTDVSGTKTGLLDDDIDELDLQGADIVDAGDISAGTITATIQAIIDEPLNVGNGTVTTTINGSSESTFGSTIEADCSDELGTRCIVAKIANGGTGFALRDGSDQIILTAIGGSTAALWTTGGNRNFVLRPGGTGYLEFDGPIVYTPSTTQAIAASTPLEIEAYYHPVVSDGGAVTVTAVPSITTSTLERGQEVCFVGTSDTDYPILQDNSNLAGSGLNFRSNEDTAVALNDILCMVYWPEGTAASAQELYQKSFEDN